MIAFLNRDFAEPPEPWSACPIHGYDRAACPCNDEPDDSEYLADWHERVEADAFDVPEEGDPIYAVGFERILMGEPL